MGVVRKTKSISQLLNSFEEKNGAMTVVELVEKHQPTMNKTTVYRALDRLESEGLLHSFTGTDGLRWYAKCAASCSSDHHTDAHPHFQCTSCGKTECLSITIAIPPIANRTVKNAEIFLSGTCNECQP